MFGHWKDEELQKELRRGSRRRTRELVKGFQGEGKEKLYQMLLKYQIRWTETMDTEFDRSNW